MIYVNQDFIGDRDKSDTQRPCAYGHRIDKRLSHLLNWRFRKASAWVTTEQARLSKAQEVSPAEFWEEEGRDMSGDVLDREEFVNPFENSN